MYLDGEKLFSLSVSKLSKFFVILLRVSKILSNVYEIFVILSSVFFLDYFKYVMRFYQVFFKLNLS